MASIFVWSSILATIATCSILPPSGKSEGAAYQTNTSQGPDTGKISTSRPVLQMVWKRELGPGNSRIIVSGAQALTLFSDGEFDCLVALDVYNGQELWRYRIAPTYRGHDGSVDGPHASPVVDDGVVYSLGPKGHLFAVHAASGKEIWKRDIREDLNATAPYWGFATTPLIEQDILIVQTGGTEGRSVTGFNKGTGEVIWTVGDDRVGYQSPAVMDLAGSRQVVAVTNKWLLGIDPLTGSILWRYEHSDTELDGSSEPITIDDTHFLLTPSVTEYRSNAKLFSVKKGSEGYVIRELWDTRFLQGNYTVPAVVGHLLFGLRGSILSCLEIQTGDVVWRSREPNASSLAKFNDDLAILTSGGFLVTAEATAEGYQETARIRALNRAGLTAPTVSGQIVFVRNHQQVAAIEISDGQVPLSVADLKDETVEVIDSRFQRWIEKVKKAKNKQSLVDEFMSSQEEFPVVEEDHLAHFVYRGAQEDVAILGTLSEWGVAQRMEHMPSTRFFYRSFSLDPESRWEYTFVVDYEKYVSDPLNPRKAPGRWTDNSELTMPEWIEPQYLSQPDGPRGHLETVVFESEILANRRDIKVYLPHDYGSRDSRYPLLIVLEGFEWLNYGLMAQSLDNLINQGLRPVIVAFVFKPKTPSQSHQSAGGPQEYLEQGGPLTGDHARMLAQEMVPFLEGRYRTVQHPTARAVMGQGSAGLAALFTLLHHSEVFGKVVLQSMRPGPTPLQSSKLLHRPIFDACRRVLQRGNDLWLEFYVDWAEHDLRNVVRGIDIAEDNRELFGLLWEKGYRVNGGEYPGGPGWGSWRAKTAKILRALFAEDANQSQN